MVMLPPHIKMKHQKMQLELAYLKMKEKIWGKLSEADKQRVKEIMKELSIHF